MQPQSIPFSHDLNRFFKGWLADPKFVLVYLSQKPETILKALETAFKDTPQNASVLGNTTDLDVIFDDDLCLVFHIDFTPWTYTTTLSCSVRSTHTPLKSAHLALRILTYLPQYITKDLTSHDSLDSPTPN